jgi:polyene glycosyltransferase
MERAQRPIMFVSLPESGLLNPMVVLAAELSRRDVPDIWFATDEHRQPDIARAATGSPVRFVSLGEQVPELAATTWDDRIYRAVTQRSRFKAHRAIIRHSYDPTLQVGKYRKLQAALDEVQPVLLVIDIMCRFAVDIAITRGIPYVLCDPYLPSMWLAAPVPFSKSYTPPGFPVPHTGFSNRMSLRQRVANRLFRLRTLLMFFTPHMMRTLARDKRTRAELGVAPEARRPMAVIDRAAVVLCLSLRELDYPFPIPPNLAPVGALIPPLPEAAQPNELADWLDAQSSVAFVGLGTVTRLTRRHVHAMVEVARRLEGRHQLLWKLPAEQQRMLPPAAALPGNLRVEQWVPSQLDVLAHPNVKAFLTHGGSNGFHEGLYFGKPLVVRPLWADCYDEAVRGADHGVGVTLDQPRDVDPEDVVNKLTQVLETGSFRERAEHFARLMREAGGLRRAADLVLGLPALGPVPTMPPAGART